MAYRRSLRTVCDQVGCRKGAVAEVFNQYNSRQGRYCSRHANVWLKDLQKREGQTRKLIEESKK